LCSVRFLVCMSFISNPASFYLTGMVEYLQDYCVIEQLLNGHALTYGVSKTFTEARVRYCKLSTEVLRKLVNERGVEPYEVENVTERGGWYLP
jgi:hypothetical protein